MSTSLNVHQSTSRPSLIRLQNKDSCTCTPSCNMLMPTLNKIGPSMSEKWLGTHLSKKMAASRPSWIWSRKRWRAYVSHHSLSGFQVWTTSVNACLRNGWGRVQHPVRNGWGRVQHPVFFTNKTSTTQPSWSWSRRKMRCICKPSFLVCLPSLTKIGKCRVAHVCHHVLCLCWVWTKSDHTCLINSWGHI